ncbi:MAG TPA: YicC/YloC family endoribonuclease [Vicinamibacteria bacterium]|nr:YicC/YloC family endoribonuclease [Vicinamibacteria bacterium]
MIQSMTGYGASGSDGDGLRASVSVKSLNHRFFELSLRVSRGLVSLEPELKDLVQSQVRRGRVEMAVQATFPEAQASSLVVNRPLVAGLVSTLRQLQAEHGLEGGLSVSDVARFPGALETTGDEAPALDDERRQRILDLVREALEGLVAMRRAEGGRLEPDLERALEAILGAATRIEALSAASRDTRQRQMRERLGALVEELGLDEARLYQEVVRASERSDVSEEVQRLRSHVAMAHELLRGPQPSGKRLDFLTQELMREANTVGSKAADADLLREVVGLKAEVEKLREQVQNVE